MRARTRRRSIRGYTSRGRSRARLLALALVVTGCGTTSGYERLLWRGPLDVGLQPAPPTAEAFAHPTHLDPAQVSERLLAIGVLRRGAARPAVEGLFEAQEARTLAQGLCLALGRAGTSERVRFSLDRQLPGEGFGRWRTTRGVAFVAPEGVLNVVFESLWRTLDFEQEQEWREPTEAPSTELVLAYPEPSQAGPDHALWYRGLVTPRATAVRATPQPRSAAEVRAQLELLEALFREGHLDEEVFRAWRAALLEDEPEG